MIDKFIRVSRAQRFVSRNLYQETWRFFFLLSFLCRNSDIVSVSPMKSTHKRITLRTVETSSRLKILNSKITEIFSPAKMSRMLKTHIGFSMFSILATNLRWSYQACKTHNGGKHFFEELTSFTAAFFRYTHNYGVQYYIYVD